MRISIELDLENTKILDELYLGYMANDKVRLIDDYFREHTLT